MRALGRVLLNTTGVLMRRGNVDTGTQRDTQAENRPLPAKERGVGRNQPCQHLELRLLAPRTARKQIFVCLFV